MKANWAVTETRHSSNYDSGRPYGIQGIVIHHWGDDWTSNHDAVISTLQTANAGGRASAHYVVSQGRVTQLVSDWDRAWHCAGNNSTTIGIECHPHCRPGDFREVAKLIAAIRSEHGNLPLSGHQEHFATACPGRYQSRLDELSDLADEILAEHNGGGVSDEEAEEPAEEVQEEEEEELAQSDTLIYHCDHLPPVKGEKKSRRIYLTRFPNGDVWIHSDPVQAVAMVQNIGKGKGSMPVDHIRFNALKATAARLLPEYHP